MIVLNHQPPDLTKSGFEPTDSHLYYELLSLEEIKTCIDQHKHLPEVPSASRCLSGEMETNGVNVSEMNMLLLRKIEELTLHLIEQNKIIAQLQEERPESLGISSRSIGTSGKKIEELTLHAIEQNKKMEVARESK